MSEPSAIGSMLVASATAAPPLLPPQVLLAIVRIQRRTEHRVEGLRSRAELRRVRLADDDRAGVTEPLDEQRILGRHEIPVDRRPECRPDPVGGLQILVRDRQAVQRPDLPAVGQVFIGEPRALHRLIGDQRDDGVDAGIDALDLREVGADHVPRRQLLGADQTRELDGAQLTDVGCHNARFRSA